MFIRFYQGPVFIICSIIIVFFALSCTEKKAEEFAELSEDIVFTDSFSPFDWENPISRQVLISGDSDIGFFIMADVTDPGKRKTLQLIEQFIAGLSKNRMEDIKKLLTDPAYNSFMLRYPGISFSSAYTIRVEDRQASVVPPEGEQGALPEPSPEKENWVRFKIIFPDRSLLGTVQVLEVGGDYKINDFENDIFDELTSPYLP